MAHASLTGRLSTRTRSPKRRSPPGTPLHQPKIDVTRSLTTFLEVSGYAVALTCDPTVQLLIEPVPDMMLAHMQPGDSVL